MNRFTDCLAFVLKREGGFVDDPLDRGGATNFGITQVAYDKYRNSLTLPIRSVKFITPEEVAAIYEEEYWTPMLPAPLSLCVFDAAVQHGTGRARKWLQRCVGQSEDGAIGPATRLALDAAAATKSVPDLEFTYTAIRDKFYEDIIAHDPSQERFRHGWENRMVELRKACES